MKVYKRLQTIARVACPLGFILLLGSVGSYELDRIGTLQFVSQAALGMFAFVEGAIVGGLMR